MSDLFSPEQECSDAMSEVVQIPSLLREYRLVEEVYRGPATVAWRAEHMASGLSARVSIVAPPPRSSREATDAICLSFRRAMERAGAFSGPDLLPFDGAAEHEGFPCAVTLLPDGTLLSDAMALSEAVSVPRVMQIGSVIGHALARLHDAGLWHGYLHPANILLVGDERPALLEPLIHAAAAAAAWQAGLTVTGSPYVGVGERAFREMDPFVDVYALASILLQVMTGQSPERMLMEQIQQNLPHALPTSLRQDLLAALNLGAQSRPPTARTLAVHLSFDVAWLRATSELAPPATTPSGPPSEEAAGTAADARIHEEPRPRSRTGSPLAVARPQLPPASTPPGVGDAPPQPLRQTALATSAPIPRAYTARPVAPSGRPAASPEPTDAAHPAQVSPSLFWNQPPPSRLWAPRWSLMIATVAVLVAICIPTGYLIGKSRFASPGTQVRGERQELVHEVQIGPYPDQPSAAIVQEHLLKAWPEAVVVLDEGGRAYIHILTTVYSDRAQRALNHLQADNYQVRIRSVTRPYSP